jgi:hypothetical protein
VFFKKIAKTDTQTDRQAGSPIEVRPVLKNVINETNKIDFQ